MTHTRSFVIMYTSIWAGLSAAITHLQRIVACIACSYDPERHLGCPNIPYNIYIICYSDTKFGYITYISQSIMGSLVSVWPCGVGGVYQNAWVVSLPRMTPCLLRYSPCWGKSPSVRYDITTPSPIKATMIALITGRACMQRNFIKS